MSITRKIDEVYNDIVMRTIALALFAAIIINVYFLKEQKPLFIDVLMAFIIITFINYFIKDHIRIGEFPSIFVLGFISNMSYVFIISFFKLTNEIIVWSEEIKTSFYFGIITLITYIILTRLIPWLNKKY